MTKGFDDVLVKTHLVRFTTGEFGSPSSSRFCPAKSADSCLISFLVYSGTKRKGPLSSLSPINFRHGCHWMVRSGFPSWYWKAEFWKIPRNWTEILISTRKFCVSLFVPVSTAAQWPPYVHKQFWKMGPKRLVNNSIHKTFSGAVKYQKALPFVPLTTQNVLKRTAPWCSAFLIHLCGQW